MIKNIATIVRYKFGNKDEGKETTVPYYTSTFARENLNDKHKIPGVGFSMLDNM